MQKQGLMAEDAVVIGVDEGNAKKGVKRKRVSLVESLSKEDIETRINELSNELNGLFKYYNEIFDKKMGLGEYAGSSIDSVIACLLEENNLPLSKLVDEIYGKIKGIKSNNGDIGGVTVASVKRSVLLIGQRVFYGVPDADVDVLEDENNSCLWCWETKDVKLIPKSMRGTLKIRKTFRKRIQERITAVSAMISTLEKSESHQNCKRELLKASERLGKVLSEAEIRLLHESMLQKNGTEMAEKEAKREEKMLVKQLEKNKREVEKEKRRMDRELQIEKLQSEKELKRLQDEAEKEERCREKEESETRKQLRRQQEEAEKDQRRREKDEAEMKKQVALQKQASLMDRFLKRSKSSPTSENDQPSRKGTSSDSFPNKSEKMPQTVTLSMDSALSLKNGINTEDLWKSHLSSWRHRGHSIRSNRKQHWSIRRKPKTYVVKELKLTTNRRVACDDDLCAEKLVDGWNETSIDGKSCITSADSSLPSDQGCNRFKQLLQFDKSFRPAFYGIWPKKSEIVGPRHPLEKDPALDYEIDSDEEWEEEEPGESLSDSDKEEEEILVEGCSKAGDEDESEDDFFVPDGYLSENEGVQVDRMDSDNLSEEDRSPRNCKQGVDSEEFCKLLRQQKYLHNLTEHALRKNQPLIIMNLMHEKGPLFFAEDLTGTQKIEQMCFQALSMCAFPCGQSIEISIDNKVGGEDQEASPLTSRGNSTPTGTSTGILDSDLPQIVCVIQSCSQSINKVMESLQQKFPTVPKYQLRNKVREISDFADNRWQVKKDILDKFGLSVSPEKIGKRTKSIATFFSKRCLPLDGKTKPNETSPQSSHKPGTAIHLTHDYSHNRQQ